MSSVRPAGTMRPSSPRDDGESSERVRLARVALTSALSIPGVLRGDSGRLHAHATPVPSGEPLHGVICAARAGGGYEVALRLVAELVPLQPLAERIGDRVSRSAAGASLELRSVSVHFADIESAAPAA